MQKVDGVDYLSFEEPLDIEADCELKYLGRAVDQSLSSISLIG